MRPEARHRLLIVLVGVTVFFTNLGATRLWDQDEAFFARTAVEMQQRHDWVVPYFNDDMFAHKPPFMYWMMRIAYAMFGTTEFAARFWSAAFAIGTALLVYQIGRRMFNSRVALWAGLAMCTALNFNVVGRAATPDSFLVFFCTLPLFLFVRHERWSEDALENHTDPTAVEPPLTISLWTYISIYAAMGIAVLVKGPIGVLLPGCTIGLYLLTRDPIAPLADDATFGDRITLMLRRFTPNRIAAAVWQMRPFTAMAAVLVVAGPWFALVGLRTHGAFLREFFGTQNLGRFVGTMDSHSGAIWYYIPAILIGFFPWSIFGIPTVLELVRRCRAETPSGRPARFLACWIVVIVGFFSLAGTKLPSYVLPAYPALALATACFLDQWLLHPAMVHRWWPRLSFTSLLLVGVIIAVAVPMIALSQSSGKPFIERLGVSGAAAGDMAQVGWLGGILILGGVAGLALSELQRHRAALVVLTVTGVALSLGIFAVAAVRFDRYKPVPELAEAIARHSEGLPQLAEFGYFQPSLVYYMNCRVEACNNVRRVTEFLHDSPTAMLVTTATNYGKLAAHLPADVVVLDRRPDFPNSGEVVVLARKAAVAQRDEDDRR